MIYKKFQKLLDDSGVSVYRVSKETGVPQSTLSEWKAGKYEPKLDKIYELAKYFNVPIEYFLEN